MTDFHGVRFYDSTESMASTAAVFICAGLVTGEAALVIATPDHRAHIGRALLEIGFSQDALRASRNLLMLDASDTSRSFLLNAQPDPIRFDRVIRAALGRLNLAATGLRIYDGMGDLLSKEDLGDAALRLERLWDSLVVSRHCSLLCGHSIAPSSPPDATRSLCACHSHVIAADGLPHRLRVA